MKKLIVFFFVILFSCQDSKPISEPKNLVPKDKMSALIADLAISDQLGILNSKGNMEVSARYILKQHNVSAKAFTESYQYYLTSPETVRSILEDAQDLVKQKDPKAEKFIDKKVNEMNKGLEVAPLSN